MTGPFTVEMYDEPARFLAAAQDSLALEPVTGTVVATFTREMAVRRAAGESLPAGYPVWWALVRDAGGEVVGIAMRTAPFEPHPLWVMSMPDEAARALARTLVARGEDVTAANGALPAARLLLAETAPGRPVAVSTHLRLFEARHAVVPPAPPGGQRVADDRDVGLLVGWLAAFGREAAEQAGRDVTHDDAAHVTAEEVAGRIAAGRCLLWLDPSGHPVHLTCLAGPESGVWRVGPVYTPPEHRGHGYAAHLVARATRRLLAAGGRVCLFTDQANPVSNRIYERIGFEPVVDMAELSLA